VPQGGVVNSGDEWTGQEAFGELEARLYVATDGGRSDE
jgi:hypothetical protein